jgi:drug/metabolite transporter (DMT)-like permease
MTRVTGIALAFAAAVISGVSIYVNGRAVKHFGDATVYTTAKNAVAGLLLLTLALNAPRGARPPALPRGKRQWLALLGIAVIGGSVPFVLFFEGLARSEATQAAFIQKTLVVWVALLAIPLLNERVRAPHVFAIALLVAGQAWYVGHAGTVTFGTGEAMILGATLLWAVEVILVKRLLEAFPSEMLAAVRMALGAVLLLGWLGVSGTFGQLTGLDAVQWRWVLLTGLLLTGYVATWYAALARAAAVDVTAVLVFGVVVTAVLAGAVDGAPVSAAATVLVTAGSALIAWTAVRRRRAEPAV